MSLTNQARALALLGQLKLVFEHSGVPLPKKRATTRRKASSTKPERARYDRDRFPVGYAASRFAKLVYSALVSAGTKVPRWPEGEDTRLSGRVPGAPITLHEMRFAAEHLKGKEPKLAKRIREELTHWRAQAKAGDAPGVVDLVSPPPPPSPAATESPQTEQAREYVGPKLPRWVEDGARVRVKATPWLRKHGLPTSGGDKADDRAWPKEVGVIRRRNGNGGWDWAVEFERGRRAVLDEKTAGYLVGVRDEPGASAEPTSPAPEGPALEAAIVADALEVVDGAPYLPRALDVRISLRPGRKYIRVFWAHKSAGPESFGSVLHFVETATGQVYRARSSKAVGQPTGRFIRPGRAKPVATAAPSEPSAELVLRRVFQRSERLTWQRVFTDLGMPRANQDAAQSGIQVRKQGPRAVSVEWVAWGGEGDAVRRARFDEAVERLRSAGYGFHLLSGEVGEAAVEEGGKRGIALVHRSKAAVESASQQPDEPVEVWERDRVVWVRPVDAGEGLRRVELRRGEGTAPCAGSRGSRTWCAAPR